MIIQGGSGMKIKISNTKFNKTLSIVNKRAKNTEWIPVKDIEDAEEYIKDDPMMYFEYFVWVIFTTQPPISEEEEESKDTFEYLFSKY